MFRYKKYIEGKYNPFELNKILLDPRTSFGSLIPSDYQKHSLLYFVWISVFTPFKAIIGNLIKTPWKYKFARIKQFRYWYDNTLLFFLPSINNQRALSKIINIIEPQKNNTRVMRGAWKHNYIPRLRIIVVSIIYLPYLWRQFRLYTHEERRIISYYFWDFFIAPGVTYFYFSILSQFKPECVVLSNDHRVFEKCLELVCEDCHVKTIYVQHASVSYAFPELHFAFSFLDGMDSYRKYTDGEKKSSGVVFLLGAARNDSLGRYKKIRNIAKRNCIGIAVNLFDSNKKVNELCNCLLQYYPEIKIKIRTHPLMANNHFHFDNEEKIIYTCAVDESMIDYLDSIDLQIGGDSGVHFDALLAGVMTIAYNLSDRNYRDNYGYVNEGLLTYAENMNQLIEKIESATEINVSKIRIYDESYNKSYSGYCSDIVADFILNHYNIDYVKDKYKMISKIDNKYNYYMIQD